jgi:hypothetical protein
MDVYLSVFHHFKNKQLIICISMLYHMHYICVLFIFQQILVYEIIDITLNNVQVSKANNLQTVYIGIMHCKGKLLILYLY